MVVKQLAQAPLLGLYYFGNKKNRKDKIKAYPAWLRYCS
jgi:hypothetical protein